MKPYDWTIVVVVALGISLNACAKNKRRNAQQDSAQTMYTQPADHGAPKTSDCSEAEKTYPIPSARDFEAKGAPAGTNALASVLRIAHARDLPSSSELVKEPGVAPRLRYLAQSGLMMVVQLRALSYLKHFPSAQTRALLMRMGDDADLYPTLRAAAIRSLVVMTSSADDAAQGVLRRARHATDPSVRKAAGASR